MDSAPIRLTQTVKKGGCAAKLPAGTLRALLKSINLPKPEQLVVGPETLDDACLYDIGDGRMLVQTIDFFTPMVDDAEAFGAIAAANALSDVYAMGGKPLTALTVLAFPTATLPDSVLAELFAGAVAKITESGACLAGGHSIDDDTLKFGFSVTGMVDRNKAWTNAGAKPGDVLILTKAIGTGTITSAVKNSQADAAWVADAIASMRQLNAVPELLAEFQIHAATDITGFGLAGHSMQVAQASDVNLKIDMRKVPVLPGARECIAKGILNRAHHSNLAYVNSATQFEVTDDVSRWLAVDPQTSGGILLAVGRDIADRALAKLQRRFKSSAIIGEVSERKDAGAPSLVCT